MINLYILTFTHHNDIVNNTNLYMYLQDRYLSLLPYCVDSIHYYFSINNTY